MVVDLYRILMDEYEPISMCPHCGFMLGAWIPGTECPECGELLFP